MNGLIGYTGTVGSTLMEQINFDEKYNSKNIKDIRGKHFSILYIAGIYANKWLANTEPIKDKEMIDELLNDLKYVTADKVILISTIDIIYFKDEPYSINRLYVEDQINNMFDNVYIIRLPGLIGKHIKKNFIFDCKHQIPKFFKDEPIEELKPFYIFDGTIYSLDPNCNKENLSKILVAKKLTSLRFTSAESIYQFFDLDKLCEVANYAEKNNIRILNVLSAPISTRLVCDWLNIDHALLGTGKSIVYDNISDGILYMTEEDIKLTVLKYMEDK